jgi:soluble lytic murein transglycosylase-like protein
MKTVTLAAIAAGALLLACLNVRAEPIGSPVDEESAAEFFAKDHAPQLHTHVWQALKGAGEYSGRRAVWTGIIVKGIAKRSANTVVEAGGSVFSMVTAAAHRHRVPVNVAHAIVKQESGYRCGVRGTPTKYGRAIGIMQTIPSTARAMIGHLPRNCAEELEAGMKYLGQIVAQHGTGCAALARYEGHRYCSPYGRNVTRMAFRS